MKKIFTAALAFLIAGAAFGQTYPSPTYGSITLQTPLTVGNGGTGSATAAGARTNLGLGSIATQNSSAVAITGGTISGLSSPIPVASGGTNVASASGTALDNITGFAGTGFLTRTGAGAYAFQSLTNGITLGNLATQAANTVLANATASSASPTAFSMPGCSAATNALTWTTSTGFTCNSAINAATLGGATFASPPAAGYGSSTPEPVAATTLSTTGNATIGNTLLFGVTASTNGALVYTNIQNAGAPGITGGNYAAMQFSNDVSSAFFGCFKSRSPTKGVQVVVQPGDNYCELDGSASDGTTYIDAGSIDLSVDGAVSTANVPTNFSVWLGNGTGGSGFIANQTMGFLIDHSANAYFRHGNVGIGAPLGYDPPAYSGTTPPYPLSIIESTTGTYLGAYYSGSTGGGAQIEVSNGFSSTVPIYGFWNNAGTGIGNPASGVTSVVTNGSQTWQIDQYGRMAHAGTAPTVLSCGTSPTLASHSTDASGRVTVGTGTVTSCTVSFAHPYATYDFCRVSFWSGNSLAAAAYSYSVNSIVTTGTNLSGTVIDYSCDGQ